MPQFSIIMCNYNYGSYIAQSIQSVLDQSLPDFELIIVDDGSADESREVIRSFDDSRIKTIFKENGGQASAFNEGFAIAQGSWLALIDSDDWWLPTKLERVSQYAELIGDGYAMVQHFLDEWCDGATRPYRYVRPIGNVWQDMLTTKGLDYFVPTSGLTFPLAIAEKVFPIPLSFWYSADAFLMRTVVAYGKLFTIPEALGYRRVHDKSFTSTVLREKGRLRSLLIPELNKFYAGKGLPLKFELGLPKSADQTRLAGLGRRLLKKIGMNRL